MSERAIKVMLVAPLPPPVGGIATWTKTMLAAPVDPDIERVHVDTSVGAAHRVHVDAARIASQIGLTVRVLSRIAIERPDVVHVTSSYQRGWRRDALFLSCARRMGAATIVHLRGGDFERIYRDASPGRRRRVRDQLRRCTAVVAITKETERFLRELGIARVELIPNCIDMRLPALRPASRPIVRWLFTGSVLRTKGIPETLAALRRFPQAHLTVAGPTIVDGGQNSADLLAAAAADPELRGRVTHVALSPDATRDAYRDHDLFVFPSHREGFPNSVLEAMEAGLPIVTTRVGAIPDMIEDGRHGLVVSVGDQEAIERAIATVTADPEFAARLGAAARARASELYDVTRVSALWCRLYRDLAHHAAPPMPR